MEEVYAVVYSNYSPYEVDSLWATWRLAELRAEQLTGDWRVIAIPVHNERVNPEHLNSG